MDRTQCSTWVAAPPPPQGPLVCGLRIAFNMYVHRLVCGLRLATLDAGETPTPHLNKKTPAVATNCLLRAWPCVPCMCTALYVDYGSLRSMRGTTQYPP